MSWVKNQYKEVNELWSVEEEWNKTKIKATIMKNKNEKKFHHVIQLSTAVFLKCFFRFYPELCVGERKLFSFFMKNPVRMR